MCMVLLAHWSGGSPWLAGLYLALFPFLWKAHVEYEGLDCSTLPAFLEGMGIDPVLMECESCHQLLAVCRFNQGD